MKLLSKIAKIILFCLLIWVFSPQTTLSVLAESEHKPKTCEIGIYLLSLPEFNFAEKTFTADFWAWSVCPFPDLKPLQDMEVINVVDVETDFDNVIETKDLYGSFKSFNKVYWAQRRFRTVIKYEWNIKKYPFDRHTLIIALEETIKSTDDFVYTVDRRNSNYDKNILLEGWKIKDLELYANKFQYETTFGDPQLSSGSSEYTRFEIHIELERTDLLGFFKLIAGVYASFVAILLGFFVELGERTQLLVGSLFAIVVNMISLQGVLGNTPYLTFVDIIHITTLFYVCVGGVTAIYSYLLIEKGKEAKSIKLDRKVFFPIFLISYLVFNFIVFLCAIKA
ncbi:hypothetical protein [Geminocystis sp. GBBB08]|uniref:hypothetical protein n=1 Tax=Geminocystis sp. GBBB08 TaxID=2604140 RepID=UPI0027E34873|nr:hypothetical protein [Geminocystis sp. GBBB08]MBL1209664.1 hypothetical protein [Geminocystis sp. GBBB08]